MPRKLPPAPVGAGHARPAGLRSRPFMDGFVGRGLDPSAGRRGRRPLQMQTESFLTTTNIRGGLRAGRPTSPLQTIRRAGLPHPAAGRRGRRPLQQDPHRRNIRWGSFFSNYSLKLSFSVTIRLYTPSCLLSGVKYPLRTNWKRSPGLASFRLSSSFAPCSTLTLSGFR